LLERVAEKFAEFGINSVRIVVAQEAEARVDFLLEEFAVHAREGGEDLDECG
jgi:hypothetical protein